MDEEYLASGFAKVDEARDPDAYGRCLSLIHSLPFYQRCKEESFVLLDIKRGDRILDAGCGLGEDVFQMAERVGEGGVVVGFDASEKLISDARTDSRVSRLPVQFKVGDLHDTGFPDNSFDKIRIDRVLQHITKPQLVIQELYRILKCGGSLLVYDNDWSTFKIRSHNGAFTRMVETEWAESFRSGFVGRHAKKFMGEVGISDIEVIAKESTLKDFGVADELYNLHQTARKLVMAGTISSIGCESWIEELKLQSDEKSFVVTLTSFLVIGRKP
ncbi:MAG: methyltransferase domain-containing protein [Verrucomicrobiota bacterium]